MLIKCALSVHVPFFVEQNSGEMFEWKPATSNNGLLVKGDIDYETVQNVSLILQASLTVIL